MSHNITISNENKEFKEELRLLAREEGFTMTTWAILQFKKAIDKKKKEQARK